MTPEELKEIGIKIHGAGWQSRLARSLSINPRTVRRWAAGDSTIPTAVEKLLIIEAKKKQKHAK